MNYDDERMKAYNDNLLRAFKLPVDERDPDYNTNAQEQLEEAIQARVDGMKEDFDTIMTILDDNWDEITMIRDDAHDQKKEMAEWIESEMRYLTELELNLI